MKTPPRVLIEDWLPAAAIGVECMRERGSASALAPHSFIHVWWARRPLTVSRAAVLGSLLPADFSRDTFEKLLGFGHPGDMLVALRQRMDSSEERIGFGCLRAFKRNLPEKGLRQAQQAIERLWGKDAVVIDPMAGGGSIPLEAARLGLSTLANEYNPVACVVLEATADYPFRFGPRLGERARKWGAVLRERFVNRIGHLFPKTAHGGTARPDGYVFARTVPCPDTGFQTPLVSDWHLLNPKDKGRVVVAVPSADKAKGTWSVHIKDPWNGKQVPRPTYSGGSGVSLFSGTVIPGDYIKAMGSAGRMKSALYAVAVKGKRLEFRPPTQKDLDAIAAAEKELAKLRPAWEKSNTIPTENRYHGDCDRSFVYGLTTWAGLFSPRQLLAMGVLVEELRNLRPEIAKEEGKELGEAIVTLLSLVMGKVMNHNCILSRWESTREVIKGMFARHDYAFKTTFAEMAVCSDGRGLDWATDNVCEAYESLASLPRAEGAKPSAISLGSATSLPQIADESVTAVVVDPPYADNVQYAELADFFYVWLKRTQGHRRPEWFSTYLCDHSEEAVVNVSRHRQKTDKKTGEAKKRAHQFYQRLMTESFREARRILRDDGVMTVMFTHKQQSAWAALFQSLMNVDPGKSNVGFQITATWPVKTESEHSLNQAKKNAAQSTVLLVCRKRADDAETGYYGPAIEAEIRKAAVTTAQRLDKEGFNPVDELVGSFGPAVSVLSQYAEVKTQTGAPVDVGQILELAAEAVMDWRLKKLVPEGLKDIDPESQFVLLCWDVLRAAEFRFNEANLLGKAVNRDVSQLEYAGLVTKSGEKTRMVPASERRRERALERREIEALELDLGQPKKVKVKKSGIRKVHPNDPEFRTAIDGCHALAMAGVKRDGFDIGAAKTLARRQGWTKDSAVAKLMAALVKAAPPALWHPDKKKTVAAQYPEFRLWHDALEPLFGIEPPDWDKPELTQMDVFAAREGEALDYELEVDTDESEEEPEEA
jgi:adenine-specific DNA methylase